MASHYPITSSFVSRISADVVVLLAGITAALHVGKLPPTIPVLQQELGVTLVQSGFLLSLVQLAGMFGGLLISVFADLLGLRRSVLAGLGLLVVAGVAGGWTHDAEALLWLRALEGVGFWLVTLSAPALIRRLVKPENLSLKLGWWSCYMGLGVGAALLLAPWALQLLGWQGWWWLMAAVTVLILLAVWLRVPADGAGDSGGVSGIPASGHVVRRLCTTLSHAGPWWVAVTFAMYSSQWLAVIGFLPSIYVEVGLSGTTLAVLTAAVALINAAGNAVAGRLMHAGVRPLQLLYAGFAAMGLGAFLAFSSWSAEMPVLRYLSVLFFSGVGGIIPASLFALSVRVAPDQYTVSTTVGWMLQLSAIGQFVGPPAVAALVALVGGWHWTWTLTLGCSVMGAVFATLASRKVYVELA